MGDVRNIDLSYSLDWANSNQFNIAVEIWLTDTKDGMSDSITDEVMFWLKSPWFNPGGTPVYSRGQDSLGSYTVYHAERWGSNGNTYTALVYDEDKKNGVLDIDNLLQEMVQNGLISDQVYVRSVEIGAEVVGGTGWWQSNSLDLKISNGWDLTGSDLSEVLTGGEYDDNLISLSGNDTLYGLIGNDKLYGGNNNDKLYGGSGNDKSYGQAGNDRLYMDAGNDTLDGGSGKDWLYVTGSANSVVNLAKTTGQNTGYGTDIIKNIENASGGKGVDQFYGTTGNNMLKGNNGNDILQGKNGNDKLYGGNNNDKLYGGNNNDKLYGGSGRDLLKGNAGRDTLQGGTGKDSLYGGMDADTFVFMKTSDSSARASSADIIRDFTRGQDKIDLHYIDASTKLSGNNTFTFDGTKSFGTSKQGDIYYKKFNNAGTSNDYTMVYIDTDSDRGKEMSIKLMGLHDLTADDFIL